jgi:hypothetical protein
MKRRCKDDLSKQWRQQIGSSVSNCLMTTNALVGINVGGAVVDPSLADVAVGYGPYFGAVLVAVRCSLARATT